MGSPFLDNMEQTAPVDFPTHVPNEMIEKVMAYLSPEDLLNLAAASSGRLKQNTFSFLRTKSCELRGLLCKISYKGDLEKIKQILSYLREENITVEEMGGQFFYVEEWGPMIFKKAFPKLLCQMSEVGDLEAMKQILSYI